MKLIVWDLKIVSNVGREVWEQNQECGNKIRRMGIKNKRLEIMVIYLGARRWRTYRCTGIALALLFALCFNLKIIMFIACFMLIYNK